MSVSQVKKRFEDMEGYLCRDKEGLRRLKLLKDDVNVLRTSLAAAVEAKETAEEIKDAARERADRAEAALKEAELKVQKLSDELASLRFQMQAIEAAKPIEEVGCADPQDHGSFFENMKSAMKRIMKRIPSCPTPLSTTTHVKGNGEYRCASMYLLDEIGKGWSHGDLWRIGAVVSAVARFDGMVVVKSKDKVKDYKESVTPEDYESTIRLLLRWYKSNIDMTPEDPGTAIMRDIQIALVTGKADKKSL